VQFPIGEEGGARVANPKRATPLSSRSISNAFADAGLLQSPGGRHKNTQPRAMLPNSKPFNAITGPDNIAGQYA
jgi:hypothetical protein